MIGIRCHLYGTSNDSCDKCDRCAEVEAMWREEE